MFSDAFHADITESALTAITGLVECPALRRLHLRFGYSSGDEKPNRFELLDEPEYVSLYEMDDGGAQDLARCLNTCRKLYSLYIALSPTSIGDAGARALSNLPDH